MILAGDIGGTKTHLGLFTDEADGPLQLSTYRSGDHDGLASMVQDFLSEYPAVVRHACFGVAGPVRNGHGETTNLAWRVHAGRLAKVLGLPRVELINDLEANAYGIDALGADDLVVLSPGDVNASGNAAVISAGTGLGEAGLFWDGDRHRPFASEGGHADFAPRNRIEIELFHFLAKVYGRVSYERVCSGMGLANVYRFFGGDDADPAAIAEAALDQSDGRAIQALDLVVSVYGAEAGNLALKLMATGGVYLGGGIPPKVLPKLFDGTFMKAFVDKGRFTGLLERIPVRVILNDKTALVGAARCAALTGTA